MEPLKKIKQVTKKKKRIRQNLKEFQHYVPLLEYITSESSSPKKREKGITKNM